MIPLSISSRLESNHWTPLTLVSNHYFHDRCWGWGPTPNDKGWGLRTIWVISPCVVFASVLIRALLSCPCFDFSFALKSTLQSPCLNLQYFIHLSRWGTTIMVRLDLFGINTFSSAILNIMANVDKVGERTREQTSNFLHNILRSSITSSHIKILGRHLNIVLYIMQESEYAMFLTLSNKIELRYDNLHIWNGNNAHSL